MKIKPEDHAGFYTDKNLGFDKELVRRGYQQFKPYFKQGVGLELGPASGYMTQYLKDDFSKLIVVEGSSTLLSQIPEYDNVIKVHSLFEEFVPAEKFDTIILNHVLEHIEKPVELLSRIKKWLKDDGRLIIGVPNAKSFHRLAAVKMGLLISEHDLNDRDKQLGHYRVYDFDSLKQQVSCVGFKILAEGGVFLKFLSNAQIEGFLEDKIVDAYFLLGNEFKHNSAEIFLVLEK